MEEMGEMLGEMVRKQVIKGAAELVEEINDSSNSIDDMIAIPILKGFVEKTFGIDWSDVESEVEPND